jgi:hypothetical protein
MADQSLESDQASQAEGEDIGVNVQVKKPEPPLKSEKMEISASNVTSTKLRVESLLVRGALAKLGMLARQFRPV